MALPPSYPTTTRKSSKIDTRNSNSPPLPLPCSDAPETVPPSIISTHSVSPGTGSMVPHMGTVPTTIPFAQMFSPCVPPPAVPAQYFDPTAPPVPPITSASATPAQNAVVPQYLNVKVVDISQGEGDRAVAWNDRIKFWVTVIDKASSTVLTQEKRTNPVSCMAYPGVFFSYYPLRRNSGLVVKRS